MPSIYYSGIIDTANANAYILPDRMTSFKFTNAYFLGRFVAIYAEQARPVFNFSGVGADISMEVYAIIFLYWGNFAPLRMALSLVESLLQ